MRRKQGFYFVEVRLDLVEGLVVTDSMLRKCIARADQVTAGYDVLEFSFPGRDRLDVEIRSKEAR